MSAKFRLSNKSHRALATEGREFLAATYPQTFAGKGDEKRPLKLGIDKDLIKAGLPGFIVCRALNDYTAGPTYRRNLIAGADRIDLNGDAVGVVTEDEAEAAAQRLSLQMARAS
jgi:ProP effector